MPNYAAYADLLVNYCVSLQPGERLFVQSTTLAEPLVREVYRAALKAGGHCSFSLMVEDQAQMLLEEGNDDQLSFISPLYQQAIEEFEAYINILAPFKLRNTRPYPERALIRQRAMKNLMKTYFERTGNLSLKR
ncbi:MAG: aminopeptidase, partial [Bacteroidota bacterium]